LRELRDGWVDRDGPTAALTRYSLDGQEILAQQDSPLHHVSDGHSTLRYHLRPADSLPERVQGIGYFKFYKETDDHILALKRIEQHPATWAEQFDADAQRYLAALDAYHREIAANEVPLAVAARAEGAAEKILDVQRASLAAALKTIKEPLFRDELEKAIKQFDEYQPMRLATARKLAKIARLPSPEWKTTDLDGGPQSVEQYRGQVVVLDFWFRGCSWCIRLMPQIEEAAAHFRKQQAPVVFLNVSTDKQEEDMRAVRDKLNLDSPILRGETIAKVYGVQGCPTLIVLDRQGVVQGIFHGFRRSRRDDLIKCVEAILAEKDIAPPAGNP
jgi:thiol-disulfide isomerase/thioredoxin